MFAGFRAIRGFDEYETFRLFLKAPNGSHRSFQAGRWGSGPVRAGNQEMCRRPAKHAAPSAAAAPDSNNPGPGGGGVWGASSKHRQKEEETRGGERTNM